MIWSGTSNRRSKSVQQVWNLPNHPTELHETLKEELGSQKNIEEPCKTSLMWSWNLAASQKFPKSSPSQISALNFNLKGTGCGTFHFTLGRSDCWWILGFWGSRVVASLPLANGHQLVVFMPHMCLWNAWAVPTVLKGATATSFELMSSSCSFNHKWQGRGVGHEDSLTKTCPKMENFCASEPDHGCACPHLWRKWFKQENSRESL